MDSADAAEIETLLADGHVVVIDYFATWCGPCKAYSPKFSRIEREIRRQFPDAKVAFRSVDIDRNHELARDARVMSVPTTVAWKMGKGFFGGVKRKEVLRFSGDRSWPDLVRTFSELAAKHGG